MLLFVRHQLLYPPCILYSLPRPLVHFAVPLKPVTSILTALATVSVRIGNKCLQIRMNRIFIGFAVDVKHGQTVDPRQPRTMQQENTACTLNEVDDCFYAAFSGIISFPRLEDTATNACRGDSSASTTCSSPRIKVFFHKSFLVAMYMLRPTHVLQNKHKIYTQNAHYSNL